MEARATKYKLPPLPIEGQFKRRSVCAQVPLPPRHAFPTNRPKIEKVTDLERGHGGEHTGRGMRTLACSPFVVAIFYFYFLCRFLAVRSCARRFFFAASGIISCPVAPLLWLLGLRLPLSPRTRIGGFIAISPTKRMIPPIPPNPPPSPKFPCIFPRISRIFQLAPCTSQLGAWICIENCRSRNAGPRAAAGERGVSIERYMAGSRETWGFSAPSSVGPCWRSGIYVCWILGLRRIRFGAVAAQFAPRSTVTYHRPRKSGGPCFISTTCKQHPFRPTVVERSASLRSASKTLNARCCENFCKRSLGDGKLCTESLSEAAQARYVPLRRGAAPTSTAFARVIATWQLELAAREDQTGIHGACRELEQSVRQHDPLAGAAILSNQ